MSEADNLWVRIQLEARISEREGMIAENKIRESRGEAMAYDDNQFFANAAAISDPLPLVKP